MFRLTDEVESKSRVWITLSNNRPHMVFTSFERAIRHFIVCTENPKCDKETDRLVHD